MSSFSAKHIRLLTFIKYYNQYLIEHGISNVEDASLLNASSEEQKEFLDSFFRGESSLLKEFKKDIKTKEREEAKKQREEEKRAQKEKERIVKSTQREHTRRYKDLLRRILKYSHERERFMVNHTRELLAAVPGITGDIRILLKNPSEEVKEFIKSTIVVEERDYSRKGKMDTDVTQQAPISDERVEKKHTKVPKGRPKVIKGTTTTNSNKRLFEVLGRLF